jgi:hypothetical protein
VILEVAPCGHNTSVQQRELERLVGYFLTTSAFRSVDPAEVALEIRR